MSEQTHKPEEVNKRVGARDSDGLIYPWGITSYLNESGNQARNGAEVGIINVDANCLVFSIGRVQFRGIPPNLAPLTSRLIRCYELLNTTIRRILLSAGTALELPRISA
jgi:hypothetical protein